MIFLTLFSYHQFNLNGLRDGRGVRVEGKLAEHDTLIEAAVVPRDIGNADGDILQVFAAVPPQTALPLPLQGLWFAIIYVDLVDGQNTLLNHLFIL